MRQFSASLTCLVLFYMSFVSSSTKNKTHVCYDNLGCIETISPWRTKVRNLPKAHSPEKIGTKVILYSKQKEWKISVYPTVSLNGHKFHKDKLTYIITHGFLSAAEWFDDLKNAIFSQVDANVLAVKWGKGMDKYNYLQAVADAQVVGRELGLLAEHVIDGFEADPKKKDGPYDQQKRRKRAKSLHFIGHSLGAHICAYAAKYIWMSLGVKVGSITALDPAQPYFESLGSKIRLSKRDATKVIVIHTSARPLLPTLGFGFMTPVGHIDFYINGGAKQPSCHPHDIALKNAICDHARAHEYYTSAISNPGCLWGHRVRTKMWPTSGKPTVHDMSKICTKEDCLSIDLDTHLSHLTGSFMVHTKSTAPFCTPGNGFEVEEKSKVPEKVYGKQMDKLLELINPTTKNGMKMEAKALEYFLN